MKVYNKRDFIKLVENNGYTYCKNQGKGSHMIFTNGKIRISIPDCAHNVNKLTQRKIIKQYKLVEA